MRTKTLQRKGKAMVLPAVPLMTIYADGRVVGTICTVEMVGGVISHIRKVDAPEGVVPIYRYVVLPGGAFYAERTKVPGTFLIGGPLPDSLRIRAAALGDKHHDE